MVFYAPFLHSLKKIRSFDLVRKDTPKTFFDRAYYVFFVLVMYGIGALCLVIFYHLHFSEEVTELSGKAQNIDRHYSLKFLVSMEIVKLTLLIAGVFFPILMTWRLIKSGWATHMR